MWFNDGNNWLAVVVQEEVATGIKVSIASSINNPYTKRGM